MKVQLQTPIAFLGFGLSGQATRDLLLYLGYPVDQMCIFEDVPKSPGALPSSECLAYQPKTVVVSPGYPLSRPLIHDLRAQGAKITSELEIAFHFRKEEKVIAITGSLGKSTTTSLVGHLATCSGIKTFAGGNLGLPLARRVLENLQAHRHDELWVLEISSYQLENFINLKANVGIITFLSPNHLERYPSLEAYYLQKWALLETANIVICNRQSPELVSFSKNHPSEKVQWVDFETSPFKKDIETFGSHLLGRHNRDNIGIALASLAQLGMSINLGNCLPQFRGLSHRLEFVGNVGGVNWVNDSKSTTVESTLEAIQTVEEKKPQRLHLLLGGRDKNLPWEKLKILSSQPNLIFHFFGEFREQAKLKSNLMGTSHSTMIEALHQLRKELKAGDWVLLSPVGTSLDEFKSFEDRGDQFKAWILTQLKDGH